MKKCLLITLILLMGVSMLYAGDNNSNISTGYLRNPVRNSITNNLDATIFNPAGTTELEEGFHIGIQNEFVLRNYSYDETDLGGAVNPAYANQGLIVAPDGESDYNSYLFPTIMANYTGSDWSAFFTFSVPGGGGEVHYNPFLEVDAYLLDPVNVPAPGLATVEVDLNARFVILGYTVGGAYKFFDKLSVSASIRMLQATRESKLEADGTKLLDTEDDAFGVGGIFGINYSPTDKLNVAARYETPVKLDYDSSGTGADDYRHDFPALFGAGIGYRVIPKLQLMADFGYNFYEQQAENSDLMDEDDYENGWTIGLGAEYDITERIMVSSGIIYTDSGVNEDSASYGSVLPVGGTPTAVALPNPNPDLGRTTFCLGGEFEVIEDLKIEAGYMLVMYRGEEDANGVEYEKEVHGISVGASYHF